jgi:hypothetical protein
VEVVAEQFLLYGGLGKYYFVAVGLVYCGAVGTLVLLPSLVWRGLGKYDAFVVGNKVVSGDSRFGVRIRREICIESVCF